MTIIVQIALKVLQSQKKINVKIVKLLGKKNYLYIFLISKTCNGVEENNCLTCFKD